MAFADHVDAGADEHSVSGRAHFVLFPLMAQGHTIPMIDMARLLAEHGAEVTFITTPVNACRMAGFVADVEAMGLKIQFVKLHFPATEFGLPDGCENIDMLQSRDLLKNFVGACEALREPLAACLHARRPPPSCIISDMTHWWTGDIARELGIPRLTFNGFCGFSSLARYIMLRDNLLKNVEDQNELITFPGFPTPLELTKTQCPVGLSDHRLDPVRKKIFEEELRCSGVIMNSFQELEPLYIESFEQITGKKVWTVGPMCLCNHERKIMTARGHQTSMDDAIYLKWLDSMKTGSVIYVSFGSLAYTAPQQLVELGLGLEASKKPFIWVIKAGDKFPEVEEWLAEGFEERVKDRGMVIRGWAPQVMILWHQAIGGFMTHCGWNSTIEGICAGVPMITWPHFAEQFVNEKLVVDVLKTGIEIGVKGATQWRNEQKEITVTRDVVEIAVSTLMGEGEIANDMRIRARDFSLKAREALKKKGSSYNNINVLIQEMGRKTNESG